MNKVGQSNISDDKAENLKQGFKIKNYVFSRELGKGAFGEVWEAIEPTRQNTVAVKIVAKSHFIKIPKVKELLNNEVHILRKVKNENLVGFIDYFESDRNCYLVLEYCNGGDLEQLLKKEKILKEERAVEYLKQILNAFHGLHQIFAMHRDIKLPNILLHNGKIKVADLGFSKQLSADQAITRTVLGTSFTMAPEVLESKPQGLQADMWSVGVVSYQMLFNTYPYMGMSDPELLNNIRNRPLKLEMNNIVLSDQCKDLLKRMLTVDPNKRIKWAEIYDHPLIRVNEKDMQNRPINISDLEQSHKDISLKKDFYRKNTNNIQSIDPTDANPKFQIMKIEEVQDDGTNSQDMEYNNNSDNPNNLNQQQKQNQLQQQILQQNQPQYPNLQQKQQQQQPNYDNQIGYAEDYEKIASENRRKLEEDQKIKMNVDIIQQKQLEERNRQNILVRASHSIHNLPKTSINVYIPAFVVLKKLLCMNEQLLDSLKNKKNKFNLTNFLEFTQGNIYKNLLEVMQSDQEIIELQYTNVKKEVDNIMSRVQDPNKGIIHSLNSKIIDQTFNLLYKDTLVNQYQNLQDEFEKKSYDTEQQKIIGKHMIEIIEIINFEKNFDKPNFDFKGYAQYMDSLQLNTVQKVIEKRNAEIFS